MCEGLVNVWWWPSDIIDIDHTKCAVPNAPFIPTQVLIYYIQHISLGTHMGGLTIAFHISICSFHQWFEAAYKEDLKVLQGKSKVK